jgi:hypothetical protein
VFWVICGCFCFEEIKQKGEGKSVIKQSQNHFGWSLFIALIDL